MRPTDYLHPTASAGSAAAGASGPGSRAASACCAAAPACAAAATAGRPGWSAGSAGASSPTTSGRSAAPSPAAGPRSAAPPPPTTRPAGPAAQEHPSNGFRTGKYASADSTLFAYAQSLDLEHHPDGDPSRPPPETSPRPMRAGSAVGAVDAPAQRRQAEAHQGTNHQQQLHRDPLRDSRPVFRQVEARRSFCRASRPSRARFPSGYRARPRANRKWKNDGRCASGDVRTSIGGASSMRARRRRRAASASAKSSARRSWVRPSRS